LKVRRGGSRLLQLFAGPASCNPVGQISFRPDTGQMDDANTRDRGNACGNGTRVREPHFTIVRNYGDAAVTKETD
jgi:hypothetical protein